MLALIPTHSLAFQPTSSLPSTFDRAAFEAYLQRRPGLLASRWTTFVQETTPLSGEVARLWAAGRLRRDDSSLAAACRSTLTRLGPTFVKLGQILSVREDVLGPIWATEMAKLQDGVEPFAGDVALGAVAQGFGQPIEMLFESLEPEPVAAASLAQVHRGLWRAADGGEAVAVAVKVLRPGVTEQVAADLCVLLRAGEVLQQWAPRLLPTSQIEWSALLAGLAAGLWEETDLSAEAKRQRRFGENMRRLEGGGVFAPTVLASTRGVMVSQWVEGAPLRALPPRSAALKAAQARMRDA
jgi:aarF domain-containing kinase